MVCSDPVLAAARSKEKAKEKAVQKETAAEARQAMKEYKFAPRPELEGNAETGYKFKEGTIGSGSQGEVASYFKEKGSSAEFRKKVDPTAAFKASKGEQLAADAPKKKPSATKELTEDEKRINAALNQFKGQKDDMGRVIGGADLAKTAATVELDATEEDLALMRSLRGGKKF